MFTTNVLGLFTISRLGFAPHHHLKYLFVLRSVGTHSMLLRDTPMMLVRTTCTLWFFASCISFYNALPCIWNCATRNTPRAPILIILSYFLYISNVVSNELGQKKLICRCCSSCATAWWALSYAWLPLRLFWLSRRCSLPMIPRLFFPWPQFSDFPYSNQTCQRILWMKLCCLDVWILWPCLRIPPALLWNFSFSCTTWRP